MSVFLEICKICLAHDVRVFKILNSNLQDIYEKLTEISFSNEDGRPLYACYMCHAFLKKCYDFRMKSLRAHEALCQLLSNNIGLTHASMELLDRSEYNLVNSLSIARLEGYTIEPRVNGHDAVVVKQENLPIKYEMVVKDEQSDETHDISETNRQSDYRFEGSHKEFLHSQDDIPLNNIDIWKKYIRDMESPHMSTMHEEKGALANREQKQDIQEKNAEERETQCKTEEQGVNTVENNTEIINEQDTNLTVIVSDSDDDSDEKNDGFICNDCGKEYFTETDLIKHIECHKLQNRDVYFKCNICSYQTPYKDSLNKHVVFHDKNRPFVCEYCNYRFMREKHLQKHLITHTRDKSHACYICKYKTVFKNNLLRHLKKHSDDKPYVCNICERKCKHKSGLITHLKKHSGDKPYACNVCDYKCVDKRGLNIHLKKHSSDKPYACNICDYKCTQKRNLKRHLMKHSGDKPYACNICEYKCRGKDELVSHLKKHSSDKPFACNICEYKFKHRSSLIMHLNKHSGVKPYACNICEYKSARKDDLVSHSNKHSGDKPYACNICDYKCIRKSYLNKHLKMHSGDKPHACNICEYKSMRKSYLVTHLKKHSADELLK